MPIPSYVRYFDDEPRYEPEQSREEKTTSLSGCQVLGWVVVGVLVLYLVSSLLMWILHPTSCEKRSKGSSGRLASSEGAVPITSDDDLHNIVTKPVNTVVIFHAPWCTHCKQTVPIYEKAALKAPEVETYMADCQNNVTPSAYGKFQVRGFPTILRFNADGEPSEFTGPRTEEAMVAFMKGN